MTRDRKTVLVTGATGFTGGFLVPMLLDRGYRVRVLVRPSSNLQSLPVSAIEVTHGDLSDGASVRRSLDGASFLIHIPNLMEPFTEDVIRAAKDAGVDRAVFVSTTAIFTTIKARSRAIRERAEAAIRDSGLTYTIIRPTMIYGTGRDRNMCRLIRYLSRWPVIPVVGNGKALQQPVFVADVARTLADVIGFDVTRNKAYNIAGQRPITYDEVIDTVGHCLGRRIWKCHLPAGPVVGLLRIFEKIGFVLPVTSEQVVRLNESKAFSYADAAHDFGYAPLALEDGIRMETQEMRLTVTQESRG